MHRFGFFLFAAALPAAAASVDFSRVIQPILVTSCQGCHGAKLQSAGLRLDLREAALKVIVPGKPAESPLYQRVTGIGEQARMPMGGKLSDAQIAAIRTWIEEGAVWPEAATVTTPAAPAPKHWAFIPPERPALPKVRDVKWVRNPIDAFVLQRLEAEKLAPSPEADRVTLLRRVSLDLTGLPPTPAEVDAFLKDKSPKAYQKQVERLLASPHYGERWGRHWLDAARYADSNGYEKDAGRVVWQYRDWVIRALNQDKPYSQFVIEQIAGDELPNATQDQVVATGFLRNSMINEEGGIDPEQFRMEAMFDRMDAIGKSMLGVTIQCAQCHNHKFDPLKQEEYYRLLSFLNSANDVTVAVYTPEDQMRRANALRRIRESEAMLRHVHADWQEQMNAWEDRVGNDQPSWTVLAPEVDDNSTGGEKYTVMRDGSMLCGGYAPTHHRVKITTKTELDRITGVRLELLTDATLPLGGPGRSIKGVGALSEFEVTAAPASDPTRIEKIKLVRATADYSEPEAPLDPYYYDSKDEKAVKEGKPVRRLGPVEYAIDGKADTAWGIDAGPGLRNQSRKAVFQFEKPVGYPGGTILTFYLNQNHGGENSDIPVNLNLGRLRLSATTAPAPTADPVPANVRKIFETPRERRSPAQVDAVFSYWRTTAPEYRETNAQIAALWREHPEGTSQLVLANREGGRVTHVLTRGDFLKPTKAVEPGVPAFLNALPADAPPTRLTFAKWLVDRKAPTTARSWVNRAWQNYFGTGIVATSEDLGRQAEKPSHPELLDWLAVEFMESGWSMKHMHRLIVESAAYRQSSRVTPELLAEDPYNRLIARGPRYRVEAEIVRDIALASSGLLTEKVGGPSVYPAAPAFLFLPPASYAPKVWEESKGADRYRRAMYTFSYRSSPHPVLQVFDAPNGDVSCVRRQRSNTPLQALTTLNEPMALETARALALHTLEQGGANDAQRITWAFRRCLTRRPTAQETTALLGFLEKQQQRFATGGADPWLLAADDPKKPPVLPNGATPAQLAAWTAVSRVLLNLDETITKE